MQKLIQIIGISFLLFSASQTFGQKKGLWKMGPSLTYNVTFFDEEVYPAFGGEISYERGLRKRMSANFAGIFHISQHDNSGDPNVTTTDYFTGIQTELRFYFGERFKSGFIGLGNDIQFLFSKNFFPPTPQSPNGNLGNLEFNIGLSFGYSNILENENLNFTIDSDLYINPFLYIGFNPSDQNEFELHGRLGLIFGL